jgi:hypothetical protein
VRLARTEILFTCVPARFRYISFVSLARAEISFIHMPARFGLWTRFRLKRDERYEKRGS